MGLASIYRFLCAAAVALFAAALLHPAPTYAAMSRYPISITQERQGEAYAIVAHNDGPAPISIRLTLSVAENVTTDRPYPTTGVVAPHSIQTLLQVRPAASGVKFRFTTSSRQRFGDPAAIPDADALYRLPFSDGTHVRISQAFGGEMTTHRGPDNLHAVDFAANEGTLVVCARSGVVIDVHDGYVEGRPDPALRFKANSVTVLHSDGTLGHYAHLARGLLVELGQHVQSGTLLGRSGNTGFSYGPHLHFAVVRALVDADGRVSHVSVPFKFYNHSPAYAFVPQQDLELTVNDAAPSEPTATRARAALMSDKTQRARAATGVPHKGASVLIDDWSPPKRQAVGFAPSGH